MKYRVYFIDFECKDLESMIKRVKIRNPEIINNLIWDENNPEYLFVSDKVYLNHLHKLCDEFKFYLNQNNENRIYIFHSWECVEPDLNLFDYSVSYDRNLKIYDRIGTFNYFLPYDFEKNKFLENNLTIEKAREKLKNLKFCNFIYSHASSPRDDFFQAISKYKHVDSLGENLNNVNIPSTRADLNWQELSINLKSAYKFSISMENSQYKGYTTEKILTSLQAHTVPIYWGDPEIAKLYNPEAFINCNDYKNFDEVINKIREIDNDDEKFINMITQKWQTPEQQNLTLEMINDYDNFINNIFSQDLKSARRRPSGLWHEYYKHRFANSVYIVPGFWHRMELRIKNFPNKIKNILGINKNKDQNN